MKKFAILFAGLFLMTFAFQSVNAQSSATATTSAKILQALTIVKNIDLNFGDISVTGGAVGTITIGTDNARTFTGGARPVGDEGTAAKFTIEGPANEAILITVPTTTFEVTNLDNVTMSVTLTPADVTAATGTTSTGGGTLPFLFGATVNVAGDQATGLYTNNSAFTVTVDYN